MTGAVAAPDPLLDVLPVVVVVLTTPLHPASNATQAASAVASPRANPIILTSFEWGPDPITML
jgi:hypothetical protein